jgi:hypothetical protein
VAISEQDVLLLDTRGEGGRLLVAARHGLPRGQPPSLAALWTGPWLNTDAGCGGTADAPDEQASPPAPGASDGGPAVAGGTPSAAEATRAPEAEGGREFGGADDADVNMGDAGTAGGSNGGGAERPDVQPPSPWGARSQPAEFNPPFNPAFLPSFGPHGSQVAGLGAGAGSANLHSTPGSQVVSDFQASQQGPRSMIPEFRQKYFEGLFGPDHDVLLQKRLEQKEPAEGQEQQGQGFGRGKMLRASGLASGGGCAAGAPAASAAAAAVGRTAPPPPTRGSSVHLVVLLANERVGDVQCMEVVLEDAPFAMKVGSMCMGR